MRHPVELETPERLADGMGGHSVAWRRLGTLWAELSAQPARAERGDVGAQARVRWKIVVPGARAGDPRRPHPGQRLRMGARVFAIEAVAETGPAGRDLVVWASEREGTR